MTSLFWTCVFITARGFSPDHLLILRRPRELLRQNRTAWAAAKALRTHLRRLEDVFKIIGEKPNGKTCEAINGLADEGAEIMKEYKKSPAIDAGLLAAAQAVEHYEISRYGTLKTGAEELGHSDAAKLLDETLSEEKETDEKLTEIAETAVNAEAA